MSEPDPAKSENGHPEPEGTSSESLRGPADPLYPDDYYESLERDFGPEKAAWARLPRAERERQLDWIHANFDTADDLDPWPPELGGGVDNP